MKKARKGPRLHSLEVPLVGTALLVASAAVAEVINPQPMVPIPLSQPWLRGAIGWRTLAVPVVSMEVLLGGVAPVNPTEGKIVLFYPLSGRKEWEFFGVLATAEPRPQLLDGSEPVAVNADLPDSPFIATGLKVASRLMLIPDLDAIKKVFYPS